VMGRTLWCACMLHYTLLKVVNIVTRKCWSCGRRFGVTTTVFWEGWKPEPVCRAHPIEHIGEA
jgi:hypothetical protein